LVKLGFKKYGKAHNNAILINNRSFFRLPNDKALTALRKFCLFRFARLQIKLTISGFDFAKTLIKYYPRLEAKNN
jgi:hypothetical protein